MLFLKILTLTTLAASFSDVPLSHPFAPAIGYVQSEGIVEGYTDGTYKPEKTINRAEFTKIIIAAALDFDPETLPQDTRYSADGLPLTDVPNGAWFTPYVKKAFETGIIGGYEDKTFRPEKTINYAEAAKIVSVAYNIPVELSETWWQGYIKALRNHDALPATFASPNQKITRGEMAELIYRLAASLADGSSPSVHEVPVMDTGVYAPFRKDVLGNGETSLLFFHASWCHYCKANDEKLVGWYNSEQLPVSTYKIDYDTSTDLRSQFSVVSQDTFVLIDGSGKEIERVSFPSEDVLRNLID